MKDIRDEILELIPLLDHVFWSYYDSAELEMNKVIWIKILPNIKEYSPLAFATRSKGLTGVYEIYVNPNIPSYSRKPLLLHEMGHVIFSHMSLQKVQRGIIINKIMSYWANIQKHIDISTYTKEEIKNISKDICESILNIAMDFEVNSKLFSDSEWERFIEYTNWAYIQAMAKSPVSTDEELKNVLSSIKDTDPKKRIVITPCWPQELNFPPRLNYKQYIDLILLNQQDFFKYLKEKLSSSENGDDSNSSDNTLTREEIDKLRKQSNDTNVDITEGLRDAGVTEQLREDKNTTHMSPIGTSSKSDILDISKNKQLEKCLRDLVFNKSITVTKTDNIYYYNRRKYNSNFLISKNVEQEVYVPGNVYLLVDCSGSVGKDTLSSLIGAVKNVAKECGQESRVIWWNTELVKDVLIKNCGNEVSNGGTNIAPGIEYVNNKYLKKRENSIFIIISDYQDTLDVWYNIIKNIKCSALGICWIPKTSNVKLVKDFIKSLKYINDDGVLVDKLLRVLPTTFVEVD